MLGQVSLCFITETLSSSRKDFITFQNKRAGSFLQAASCEFRDDPWRPARFPLFWENLSTTALTLFLLADGTWQPARSSFWSCVFLSVDRPLGEACVFRLFPSSLFHGPEFFPKLSLKVHNKRALVPVHFSCLEVVLSSNGALHVSVDLLSTLKNICSSKERRVRRTDIRDRLWFVFPELACFKQMARCLA